MATAPLAPPAGAHLRTLRGLAAYACGHTGSCCRAGWPIPIEAAPLAVLRRAEAEGALPRVSQEWERKGILCHSAEHECVFHAPSVLVPGCMLEHSLGSAALPISCRQFPRILLADARGWHQSVSAWCGTAASLLVRPSSTGEQGSGDAAYFLSFDHICADPRVHLESLDARGAWPPFLRPGTLAGHEVYDRWESHLLRDFLGAVLRSHTSVAHMLASALCWTDVLRAWRASDGALEVLARRPWRHPDRGRLLRQPVQASTLRQKVLDELASAVPAPWQPAAWPAGLIDAATNDTPVSRQDAEAALARYLGTRLVASWVTYQGQGLRSVTASLVSALSLVALALIGQPQSVMTIGRLTSAIRASDWLLLHLLDRERWADWCSAWEDRPDSTPLMGLVAGADALLDACAWSAPPMSGSAG